MPAVVPIIAAAGTVAASNASAKGAENAADVQAKAQTTQIGESARQFDITNTNQRNDQAARLKAYNESIARGESQMGEGESSLMASLDEANPELAQQEADLRSGNAKALQDTTGQISSNLARQGVRGGQAATLLGRSVGEMGTTAQKDINQMKFQDADTRAAQKRAYLASKAGRGQAATLPAGAI